MADARLDIEIRTTGADAARQELERLKSEAARTEAEIRKLEAAGNSSGNELSELKDRLRQLNDQMRQTGQEASGLSQSVNGGTSSFAQMRDAMQGPVAAARMVVDAFRQIATQVDEFISAAAESERAMANLTSVLRATGGVVGMTAWQLSDLAEELHRTTLFEDDAVIAAETVLLTFKQIGSQVFPDAVKAAADMATVMRIDLQSAVVMVGKALNDPVDGIGALRRGGVQLTDQQEEMVKKLMASNDVLGAQAIILKELQAKFGGAAQAMGNLPTSSVDNLKKAFSDLKEEVGFGLSDSLTPLIQQVTDLIRITTDGINKLRLLSGRSKPAGLSLQDDIAYNETRVAALTAERDKAEAKMASLLAADEAVNSGIAGKLFGPRTSPGLVDLRDQVNEYNRQIAEANAIIASQRQELAKAPPPQTATPSTGSQQAAIKEDWERATDTNWQKGDADVKAYLAKILADYAFSTTVLKDSTEKANSAARSDILRVIDVLRGSKTGAWANPSDSEIMALVDALKRYPEPVSKKAAEATASPNEVFAVARMSADEAARVTWAAMNARGIAIAGDQAAEPTSNWDYTDFKNRQYAEQIGEAGADLRYAAMNLYGASKGAVSTPTVVQGVVSSMTVGEAFRQITGFSTAQEYLDYLRKEAPYATVGAEGLQEYWASDETLGYITSNVDKVVNALYQVDEARNSYSPGYLPPVIQELIDGTKELSDSRGRTVAREKEFSSQTGWVMDVSKGGWTRLPKGQTQEKFLEEQMDDFSKQGTKLLYDAGTKSIADGFMAVGEAIAGSTDSMDSFGESLQQLSVQLIATISEMAIAAGLKRLFINPADPVGWALLGGGVAGSITAGAAKSTFARYAEGTSYHPGGMAIVGEQGPELVSLPMGSSVTPSRAIGSSSITVNVVNTSRASVDAQVEERQTSDGREYRVVLRDAVSALVASGALDKPLSSRYGVRSIPRRVN